MIAYFVSKSIERVFAEAKRLIASYTVTEILRAVAQRGVRPATAVATDGGIGERAAIADRARAQGDVDHSRLSASKSE